MSVCVDFESYDNNEAQRQELNIRGIESVSFSYDGGRLHVYVNGKEILENMGAGNDIYVSVKLTQ